MRASAFPTRAAALFGAVALFLAMSAPLAGAASGQLGLRAGHTRQLSAQLPAEQRFNLQNFLPVTGATAPDEAAINQARVAGYTFLRSLNTAVLRQAVGQAPNRNYAQIQQQLAQQQKDQQAALLGQGDLSALLFDVGQPGDTPSGGGVDYLTPAQVAAITGWKTAKASWYGSGFYGRHTADGTTYNATIILVANKTLPFGTKVAISYGGRTVIAPVKDRGPYVAGRDFDLSAGLAKALGFSGVQTIRWAIVP